MILSRRLGLANAVVCLCLSVPSAVLAQQPAPPPAPQQRAPTPFEPAPQAAEPPKAETPQAPPAAQPPTVQVLEPPKAAEEPKAPGLENTVEAIEFRGAR